MTPEKNFTFTCLKEIVRRKVLYKETVYRYSVCTGSTPACASPRAHYLTFHFFYIAKNKILLVLLLFTLYVVNTKIIIHFRVGERSGSTTIHLNFKKLFCKSQNRFIYTNNVSLAGHNFQTFIDQHKIKSIVFEIWQFNRVLVLF